MCDKQDSAHLDRLSPSKAETGQPPFDFSEQIILFALNCRIKNTESSQLSDHDMQ